MAGTLASKHVVALVFAALSVRCAGFGHVLESRVIASGESRHVESYLVRERFALSVLKDSLDLAMLEDRRVVCVCIVWRAY